MSISYSFHDLRSIFEALELKAGDTVYLASDVTRLCDEAGGSAASDMIGCIQRMITESGTLLVPTFSWDFCHDKGFDIRRTHSRTGALSRIALRSPGFIRTRHPIYSFAVWGADAQLYASLENVSAFGPGSPFGVMTEHGAYLITFCVRYETSLTYQHYVEEMIGVPWRYMKDFTGEYTDESGSVSVRTYSMYVRDLDMDVRDADGYDELSAERAASIELDVSGAKVRKAYLSDIYKMFESDIKTNAGRGFVHYKKAEDDERERAALIAEALETPEPSDITPDALLEDIPEWDSLGKINLITLVKSRTGKLLDIAALERFKTVGDIIAVMK